MKLTLIDCDKNVLNSNGDELYYRFTNSEKKTWDIPGKNSKQALQLYQPGNISGKILKIAFPIIIKNAFIRQCLGITVHKSMINTYLSEILCNIYNVNDINVTVFYGTPSIHQKTTMQISNGNNILGYCKLSEKKDIKELFRFEQVMLSELHDAGVKGIPKCLYNGEWRDGINIFAQTTTKTNHSKVSHKLSEIHWEYLEELYMKTKKVLPFEQSDFYMSLLSLKANLNILSSFNSDPITTAIKQVEQFYSGKNVDFSVYQADFTPWNMFTEQGELFVFDWEYSGRTYPPFMDAFHFFTQTNIFENHKTPEQIIKKFANKKDEISLYFSNPEFTYKCYLLNVLSFYTNRDKHNNFRSTSVYFDVWIKILSLLNKR